MIVPSRPPPDPFVAAIEWVALALFVSSLVAMQILFGGV